MSNQILKLGEVNMRSQFKFPATDAGDLYERTDGNAEQIIPTHRSLPTRLLGGSPSNIVYLGENVRVLLVAA